jgi:transposase
MRQKSMIKKDPAEKEVRDIRRKTRKQYSAEEKIRIVLSGLRGEERIAANQHHQNLPAKQSVYPWQTPSSVRHIDSDF